MSPSSDGRGTSEWTKHRVSGRSGGGVSHGNGRMGGRAVVDFSLLMVLLFFIHTFGDDAIR